MSRLDLSADKPAANTLADATAISDAFTKIETAVNANPSVTASALSGGPPSDPAEGDIWVATGVDGNGTCWQFRYNAGSASAYKWEFIGGSTMWNTNDNPNQVVNTGDPVSPPNSYSPSGSRYVCVRAGEYVVAGAVDFYLNGASTPQFLQVSTFINGATYAASNSDLTAADAAAINNRTLSSVPRVNALAVNDQTGLAAATSANGTIKFTGFAVGVTPRRIA